MVVCLQIIVRVCSVSLLNAKGGLRNRHYNQAQASSLQIYPWQVPTKRPVRALSFIV
jgi:hypothetical protein